MSAASGNEASAAHIDIARLAKAASEIEWCFHIPMDESEKDAALSQPGGVTQAVEGLGSRAQQALLRAARNIDFTTAGSRGPASDAATSAARTLGKDLDQRIASLKAVCRMGIRNDLKQEVNELTGSMSTYVGILEKLGGPGLDLLQAMRAKEANLARLILSPAEQVARARSELDRQCELLAQHAEMFSRLEKSDLSRLAPKWREALSLAVNGRIDLMGESHDSDPASSYLTLLGQINNYGKIKDNATMKQVLTAAKEARRNWPKYAEDVHRNAWSSWADMKVALALSRLARNELDARQRMSVLIGLLSRQSGALLTRFELKAPKVTTTPEEHMDKADQTLRHLVDKPKIQRWEDTSSGEFEEIAKEASDFAQLALTSLLVFAMKIADAKTEPEKRERLTPERQASQEKPGADETTFYAGIMIRMAQMAQTLKAELGAIDARIAEQAVRDQSQDSKGKGHEGSGENRELRVRLQTLMQPLDVIETASREFMSLLVPNATEEDLGKLALLGQAPNTAATSEAETDDIDGTHPASADLESAIATISGGATEAKSPPQETTFSKQLKSMEPPKLETMMLQMSNDPITFQQMKAVLDPFLKRADENWSKAVVALNNHNLASFDRKKRQQLLGCANELQQASEALTEARREYNKALTEANENSSAPRKFPMLEEELTRTSRLYKRAARWVRNWADNPASQSFTERVKQGHLHPSFSKDASDEGFCFPTSYGWTVEAFAPQAPVTLWDGATERAEDIVFHFHFRNDPTSIPMSAVTKDMLAVMTVKQKGDRFVTHRKDADGKMQHVPEIVLSQDDAWEVFKRVVQPQAHK